MPSLFDGGLDKARLVTQYRSLLGYTGTYKGKPVSVQTSGMGTPSFSIVMEELLNLGVKRFIRTGTCGGIGRGLQTGDVVVATAAVPATALRGRICTAIRLPRPRTSS